MRRSPLGHKRHRVVHETDALGILDNCRTLWSCCITSGSVAAMRGSGREPATESLFISGRMGYEKVLWPSWYIQWSVQLKFVQWRL